MGQYNARGYGLRYHQVEVKAPYQCVRLATSEAVRERKLQGSSTYKPQTFITHRPISLAIVVACTAKPVAGCGVIQPSPKKLLFQQQMACVPSPLVTVIAQEA